jgi:hypothetical protein
VVFSKEYDSLLFQDYTCLPMVASQWKIILGGLNIELSMFSRIKHIFITSLQ